MKHPRNQILLSFVLICLGCVLLQIFLMRVLGLRTERYATTTRPGSPAATLEGNVTGVELDRFRLQTQDQVLTLMVTDLRALPEAGSHVRVTYLPGNPARALTIEKLPAQP